MATISQFMISGMSFPLGCGHRTTQRKPKHCCRQRLYLGGVSTDWISLLSNIFVRPSMLKDVQPKPRRSSSISSGQQIMRDTQLRIGSQQSHSTLLCCPSVLKVPQVCSSNGAELEL
ncbi:hypothetical protein M404DRAFT_714986 [Pisolithus tinctorius Marx 270]|uniref:Uncharacterized protein n=1 Tax=Pisolithus tinctorius Marx 270 TaxID=870435 RepID=A0A0C3NMQ7_PISTI|nr:hypothetical protein M404DRAFT_714986 [Pisolithus tinctorius Marx 270]